MASKERSYNNDLKLQLTLLSACLVMGAQNAISGMIPEMAKAFSQVSLSTIELITTIPSLFQMIGILISKPVADRIGHKNTMLFGFLFCGLGGVIPTFLPLFGVIFVTRCLFGLGVGFLCASQLVLIIHFFTGHTRSNLIGLNGTFGGIGSAVLTFLAGRLLAISWNSSFAVYIIGFIVGIVSLAFIPNVPPEKRETASGQKAAKAPLPAGLIGLAILDLVAVMMATFYVIKASTYITSNGFGTAAEGSTALAILSIGSLCAGLSYGKARDILGHHALTFFFVTCLLGNLIGGLARGCAGVYIGAFFLGYGYLGFLPFIQEEASVKYGALGQRATNTILILQSLGAFFTPYICPVFDLVSKELQTQFFLVSACYGILTVIAVIYAMRNRK